jgi:hypothetical protein
MEEVQKTISKILTSDLKGDEKVGEIISVIIQRQDSSSKY